MKSKKFRVEFNRTGNYSELALWETIDEISEIPAEYSGDPSIYKNIAFCNNSVTVCFLQEFFAKLCSVKCT